MVMALLVLFLLPVINIYSEELKQGCKIEKPGVFPASGDVVLGSPVGGAVVGIPVAPEVGIPIVAVVGILEIRLTMVPHKIN